MKVRSQLFWVTVFLGTILIVIINFYRFQEIKKILVTYGFDHLEAISESKVNRIKNLLKEKFDKGNILANDLLTKIDTVDTFCEDEHCRKNLNKIISTYLLYKLEGVSIMNNAGHIIATTDSLNTKLLSFEKEFLSYGRKDAPYMDIFPYNEDESYIFYSYPLKLNNRFIGVIILKEVDQNINMLTDDYTGLENSGETYIGKVSDSTYFLNPLRFDRKAAFKRKVSANDTGIAMNKALLFKKNGFCVDCKDYRGIKVISSYQYIPEIQWGIVTEMDRSEILNPLKKVLNLFIYIALFSLMALALIAFVLGSYFTNPITRLITAINKFRFGNLSARSEVNMNNEIGMLSNSFNDMAGKIESNMNQLNKANQALNKFGYAISHDLKGPLQSIYSLAELIKDEYANKPLTGEGMQMQDMIIQKAKLMEEMINNVLTMARTGGQFQDKHLVNTNNIVNEAIQSLRIPPHIRISISQNLPDVYYSKTALFQIFLNLISNAVKYNDKSHGWVNIYAEELKDKFCFVVNDNGRGIKEKDFNKIFNIFGTPKEKPNKIDSTGIGLSTVKEIVTENHGEIWVESEEGKGSTFNFTIPK